MYNKETADEITKSGQKYLKEIMNYMENSKQEFEVIQSVVVNPKNTVKCLCIATKENLTLEGEENTDFIKDKIYDCAKYKGVDDKYHYTVIYKSDDYEERVEGTKFYPIKGSRSSFFLNEEEFLNNFVIQ